MIKTKTFDCVAMKNKIQAEIISGRKPSPNRGNASYTKKIAGFLKKIKKIKA